MTHLLALNLLALSAWLALAIAYGLDTVAIFGGSACLVSFGLALWSRGYTGHPWRLVDWVNRPWGQR